METITADIPYPPCGNNQWMTIIRDKSSERNPNPALFLSPDDIPRTVLASAFIPDLEVFITTPLPFPHNKILLPTLTKSQLRPEVVRDENGRVLGHKCVCPSLFTWANLIVRNRATHNLTYDYATAVRGMVKESGRLLGSILNKGVIRVRERPCLMAHALELSEMGYDEVGISEEFAAKILPKIQELLPLRFGSVWDMDGFPVYYVRFPVANKHGISSGYLRILKGKGRYIGIAPFNLGKMLLGDRDGDSLFVLFRCKEIQDGLLEMAKRPRVVINQQIKKVSSVVELGDLVPLCKGEGL